MPVLEALSGSLRDNASRLFRRGEKSAADSLVRDAASRNAVEVLGRDMRVAAPTAAAPVNSVVHFDANSSLLSRIFDKLGWKRPHQQVAALNDRTFLHYSTDGATWRDRPLQYLQDSNQGFLLPDVAPGTKIQGAIHAEVGVSHNGFYSMDATHDEWLNTWGNNFDLTTEVNK